MHEFHEYLSRQLVEYLRKRRIVVWYDPKEEFRPYIRELRDGDDPEDCRPNQVRVGEVPTRLCELKGSSSEEKFTVEPVTGETEPDHC